jgi:hypothetical protein
VETNGDFRPQCGRWTLYYSMDQRAQGWRYVGA